jgi:N-acetylmuramoyl-L-alanine amidase
MLVLAATAFAQPVVTVDPGHPSEVADGAGKQNGTSEVHEAWEVGLKLRALLEEAGVKVVMTKARERELVKNRRRAEIANEAGSALMVRLHCDTAAGAGYALYYPDRKGHTQGVTGPDDSIIVESGNAARAMHAGMAAELSGELHDNGVKGDSQTFVGGKQGALTGSIFSKVPAVTIEMVVLSNPRDAAWIRTSAGEAKMARALFAGIANYLKLSRAASSAPASRPSPSGSPSPSARPRPAASPAR